MEDNFYITLPSNVKSFFPDNKIGNFKTKLAKRINLEGDYEVGLVDISYTYSWYNLVNEQTIFLSYLENNEIKIYSVKISSGQFNSIQELVSKINTILELIKDFEFGREDRPSIAYNNLNYMITINHGLSGNNPVFLSFTPELCYILGIKDKKLNSKIKATLKKYKANTENKNESPLFDDLYYYADYPIDLSGGYHSLYVYSDIVKPSLVGNSFTHLLKLVAIPNNIKYGQQVLINYPNPFYVPVLIKEFDTIQIMIRDGMGNTMPFKFGRSILVLHFRKIYKKDKN